MFGIDERNLPAAADAIDGITDRLQGLNLPSCGDLQCRVRGCIAQRDRFAGDIGLIAQALYRQLDIRSLIPEFDAGRHSLQLRQGHARQQSHDGQDNQYFEQGETMRPISCDDNHGYLVASPGR